MQALKGGTGHYVFTVASELMGGLRLTLANAPKFRGAVARFAVSEQLSDDGVRPRVPCFTGATFTSNFSLQPGAHLERSWVKRVN